MSKRKRRPNPAPATNFVLPSPQEIVAAMSERGGWTRATLAGWGIKWPPKKGWRQRLEAAWLKAHPQMCGLHNAVETPALEDTAK